MSVFVQALEARRMCSTTAVQLTIGGYAPDQIREAYGFNQVQFSKNGKTIAGNGAGQTIAIVNPFHAPNIKKDLKVFNKQFGISNRDSHGDFALSVATPQGKPPIDVGWAQETSMDVEWAHAIAPAAHILLVEAKSDTTVDLFSAIDFARKKRGVVAVSLSWGWNVTPPEAPSYNFVFTTPANHRGGYKKGDGVSFVVAAGDNGVPNAWPDSSVNVISVGGTSLTLNSDGSYASETLLAQSAQSATVDYDADINPGFAMYDSTPVNGVRGWQLGSGTSAGAPQWAALLVIADQGRAILKKHSLDGTTQTLAALQSISSTDFHAVTNGGTAAGRGSPFADQVITDLVNV